VKQSGPPRCANTDEGLDRTPDIDRRTIVTESLQHRVEIRIEPAILMFYDPDSRELLRTRPNPLTPEQVQRLRGVRPAGPPPRPSTEPIRVQRRVSNTGVIMVAGQKIALGRLHQHRTLTVTVSDTTLINLGDGDVKVVRRTNSQPVRSLKGQRPRIATSVS
jgi:hypothetical protein